MLTSSDSSGAAHDFSHPGREGASTGDALPPALYSRPPSSPLSHSRALNRLTGSSTRSFTVTNFTRAVVSYAKLGRNSSAMSIVHEPAGENSPPPGAPITPLSIPTEPLPALPSCSSVASRAGQSGAEDIPEGDSIYATGPLAVDTPTAGSRRNPQARISLLKTLRHRRATEHIASYIRILAHVSSVRSFPVTVRRLDSIEDLARQIEAEYAFRYPCSRPATPLFSPTDRGPAVEVDVDHSPNAAPLICGALLLNDIPLLFDACVDDVLAMDDTITVVNLHDGEELGLSKTHTPASGTAPASPAEPANSFAHPAAVYSPLANRPPTSSLSMSIGIQPTVACGADPAVPWSEHPLAMAHPTRPPGLPLPSSTFVVEPGRTSVISQDSLSSFASQRSETSMRAAIHHAPAVQVDREPHLDGLSMRKAEALFTAQRLARLALPRVRFTNLLSTPAMVPYFLHYCLQAGDFALESALFWLDVERFRSTQSNVCRLTANYIYITYLAPQAPLFANVSGELRNEIAWPFLPGWHLDTSVFDEAQEWVFQTMKHRHLTRFERGELFQEMLDDPRCQPQDYVQDRPGPGLTDRGPAWHPVNVDVVLWINDLDFNDTARPLVAELSRLTDEFREELAGRILDQFEPLGASVAAVDGYFTSPQRMTHLQKNLRMQRNKRLIKFFGDKPEAEVLAPQLDLPFHGPALSVMQQQRRQQIERLYGPSSADLLAAGYRPDRRASVGSVNYHYLLGAGAGPGPISPHRVGVTPEAGYSSVATPRTSVTNDPQWNTYTRKKKLEKLEEFFGNRIPEQILVEQQLIDGRDLTDWTTNPVPTDSETSDHEIILPTLATHNDLTQEQKRVLTKRRRKLKYMLGEPLAEATVEHNVTAPYMRTALGRQRSYTTSDLETPSLTSPRTPFSPITEDDLVAADLLTSSRGEPEIPIPHLPAVSAAGFTPLSPKPVPNLSVVAPTGLGPEPLPFASLAERRGLGQFAVNTRQRTMSQPGSRGSAACHSVNGTTAPTELARLGAETTAVHNTLHPSPSLPDLRQPGRSGAADKGPEIPQRKGSLPSLSPLHINADATSLAGTGLSPLGPDVPDERHIRRRQFDKLRDMLGANLPFDTISTVAPPVAKTATAPEGNIFQNEPVRRGGYQRHISLRPGAGPHGAGSPGPALGSHRVGRSLPGFAQNIHEDPNPVLPSQPSSLTPEEKSRRIKRANKLERMFGEYLPSKARLQLMTQPAPVAPQAPGLPRSRSSHRYSQSVDYLASAGSSLRSDASYYDDPGSSASSGHPLLSSPSSYQAGHPQPGEWPAGGSLGRAAGKDAAHISRTSLTSFLNDEEAVNDFVDYVTEVTLSRQVSVQGGSKGHVSHSAMSRQRSVPTTYSEVSLDLDSKQYRQRRMLKLHRFFGDAPSLQSLQAQNILFARLEPIIEHRLQAADWPGSQGHYPHAYNGIPHPPTSPMSVTMVGIEGPSLVRAGGLAPFDAASLKHELKQDLLLLKRQISGSRLT